MLGNYQSMLKYCARSVASLLRSLRITVSRPALFIQIYIEPVISVTPTISPTRKCLAEKGYFCPVARNNLWRTSTRWLQRCDGMGGISEQDTNLAVYEAKI